MGFKEMKMMKSTEPSVDEAGKGMKKGGVTGEAMRKYGRNLARAMNQRGK
jgi:hypothetical protein